MWSFLSELIFDVLWHERSKSHERKYKEDGWSEVGHEQLVAEKPLESREKCVLCLALVSLQLLLKGEIKKLKKKQWKLFPPLLPCSLYLHLSRSLAISREKHKCQNCKTTRSKVVKAAPVGRRWGGRRREEAGRRWWGSRSTKLPPTGGPSRWSQPG